MFLVFCLDKHTLFQPFVCSFSDTKPRIADENGLTETIHRQYGKLGGPRSYDQYARCIIAAPTMLTSMFTKRLFVLCTSSIIIFAGRLSIVRLPTWIPSRKDRVTINMNPGRHHCPGSRAARNLIIPVLWLMEFSFDVSLIQTALRPGSPSNMVTDKCPLPTFTALSPNRDTRSRDKPLGVTGEMIQCLRARFRCLGKLDTTHRRALSRF